MSILMRLFFMAWSVYWKGFAKEGRWADLKHRHGVQGEMNGASNSTLDNEFGTHKEEEVIVQILEKGTIQESKVLDPPFSSDS